MYVNIHVYEHISMYACTLIGPMLDLFLCQLLESNDICIFSHETSTAACSDCKKLFTHSWKFSTQTPPTSEPLHSITPLRSIR